jgi:hypothetical protein
MHRQSLGREPDRAAVTGAMNDRSERIGFSVRLLAIRSGACATPERSLQGQSGDNKAAVQEVRAKISTNELRVVWCRSSNLISRKGLMVRWRSDYGTS